jgi:amino acid transporter
VQQEFGQSGQPSRNPAADGPSAPGYRQELDRALGLRQLVVYGMVFIVPIAPVAVYGFVAHASHGMVPLVYLTGMVAMLFTALSYRELSAKFPYSGSVYTYVSRALGPFPGFIAGWMILADYLLVPGLVYAFVSSWLHGLLPGVPPWLWIVVLVVINTGVNLLGIRLWARTNLLLLVLELLALAVFVALASWFVFVERHGTGGFSFAPLYQPGQVDFGFVAAATSIAALSFLGFDGISTLAEETRDPRRDVGNATLLTLLLLGVLFVMQTWLAALAHPDFANLDPKLGFFQIAREVGGAWFFAMLIVVKAIATGVANAQAAQAANSRILYAMGRDRALPFGKFLSNVDPRRKLPANAVLSVACLSLLLALLVPEEALLRLVNFGALSSFLLLNLAVPLYFLPRATHRRWFRHLVLPVAGLAVIGFVFSGFDRLTLLFGTCWLLAGAMLGWWRRGKLLRFEGM